MADLKLLADSLFAHGVNQVVWNGMPFICISRADGVRFADIKYRPPEPARSA